ncbi:MAG: glycosyltransferase, partial [Cetobacterium sp.]
NGKSGVLYPVGDSEKLSQEIEKILKNPEIKERYKMNSEIRVLEFNTKKVMKRYEEIIEE